MNNISLNGEPIFLQPEIEYFVIDALYLNDVRNAREKLSFDNIDEEIRQVVFPFPYTDTPFARFKPKKKEFNINEIKSVTYEEVLADKSLFFSTDTGLILFIAEKIFGDMLKNSDYDYDILVDSSLNPINIDYWDQLVNDYPPLNTALVVSPGINSEVDFKGSGLYKSIG